MRHLPGVAQADGKETTLAASQRRALPRLRRPRSARKKALRLPPELLSCEEQSEEVMMTYHRRRLAWLTVLFSARLDLLARANRTRKY